MIDFSIIIPVYNAEKMIKQCLKSLQMQTLSSFEVLVIDDGSSDESGTICDSIAAVDDRFRVIHQENTGPSDARNTGLTMARGRFVAFVDSDDTVEPDYLECLKKEFDSSGADVVFMGYAEYSQEGIKVKDHIPGTYSNDYIKQLAELSSQDLFGYTWVKAFKKSAIGENRFRKEISLFEDEIFACEVLTHCKNVSIIERSLYHYVCGNSGALMGKTHQDYCELQDQVYRAWESLVKDSEYRNEILEKKADALAMAFQYYLFERKININAFLESASKCTFIRKCTLNTPFFNALRNKNWFAIKRMRYSYLIKVKISGLVVSSQVK